MLNNLVYLSPSAYQKKDVITPIHVVDNEVICEILTEIISSEGYEVRNRVPNVGVAIMSGMKDYQIQAEELNVPMLNKPFKPDSLPSLAPDLLWKKPPKKGFRTAQRA